MLKVKKKKMLVEGGFTAVKLIYHFFLIHVFFQVGENFPVFSPSQNLLGVSQHLQHQLWTMAPPPGASPQGEWEHGETVATSPLDPMAGPMDPQVLHPASQVTFTNE